MYDGAITMGKMFPAEEDGCLQEQEVLPVLASWSYFHK